MPAPSICEKRIVRDRSIVWSGNDLLLGAVYIIIGIKYLGVKDLL